MPDDTLFAAVFERARDALLIADDAGRYVHANPAAAELTGWSRDELLAMSVFDITPAPNREAARAMWARFLDEGAMEGEYRLVRRDGRAVDVEFRAVAQVTPGRHLSALRDVSERNRLMASERALHETQQRLMGIVGHDLRSPLAAIVAGAEGLRRRLAGRPEAQAAERILSSASRMAALVGDLVDYARETGGRGLALARRRADAHRLCAEVVDELRLASPSVTVELQARGDGDGEWDPPRLQQLIANLVGNAIQHGTGGRVRVDSDGEAGAWRLTVHNAGAIAADLLPRVFEPFVSTRDGGLGLYIARAIARAHGGTLDVTSDPVAGTTFVARLPR